MSIARSAFTGQNTTRSIVAALGGVTATGGVGVVTAPALPIGPMPTFQLETAAVSGTYPFTTGLVFLEGAAPTGLTTDLTTYQVDVMSRWPDNSVRHALISGRRALTSTPLTVNTTAGTSPGGTALTRAALEAAITAGHNQIVCSGFGTVDLQSILTSGFLRQFVAGPEMVECHYAADVGGGTNLRAQFLVRLYADARVWIHESIENGKVGGSANADRTYDVTFRIGNAVIYNAAGALHLQNTSMAREGWIGGDPQVTAVAEMVYVRKTGMVPNYKARAASAGYLAGLSQDIIPMATGPYPLGSGGMSSGGAGDWIAHLPRWAALYITTPEKRTYKHMMAVAAAYRSVGITFRDASTNRVPRPGNHPNLLTLGSGGGNGIHNIGSGANIREWEYAHFPEEGSIAWLFSGNFYHWETQAFNAFMTYATNSVPHTGSGTSRVIGSQERSVSWAMRTYAKLCAYAPTSVLSGEDLQVVNDWKTLLAANYTWYANLVDIAGITPLGTVYHYQIGGGGTGRESTFMQHMWVAVNGHVSDLKPIADMSNILKLRDWMYRRVVGILGPSGTPYFHWSQGGRYDTAINDDNNVNPTTFLTTWGAVWTQTFGSPNAETTNNMQGTSGADPALPDGYWGNLLPAITSAVTHGAPGALAAYNRLIGATNWSTFDNSGFGDKPHWGTEPRAQTSALAIACAGMSVGQWLLYADDNQKGWNFSLVSTGTATILDYAAKGFHDPRTGEIHYEGQGHQETWKHIKFSESADVWSQLSTVAYDGSTLGHNFDSSCMDTEGNIYRRIYNSTTFKKYTKSTGVWANVLQVPANDGIIASVVWHPGFKRVVYACAGNVRFYNPIANTWASGGTVSGMAPYSSVSVYCPIQDVVVFGGGVGANTFWKVDALGVVTQIASAPVSLGTSNTLGLIAYDGASGKLVAFDNTVDGQAAFPIYEYNFATNAWSSVGTAPISVALLQSATISLYQHNRIMLISANPRRVYLYRHS